MNTSHASFFSFVRAALCGALLMALPSLGRAQNGQPNQRYTPGQQGDIYAFAVAGTGVFAGGSKGSRTDANGNFIEVTSLNRYVSSDGSRDAAFNVNPDGRVFALARYADGRLLIAGDFGQVNAAGTLVSAPGVARLKADGSVDGNFQADITLTGGQPRIVSVLLQADGKVLIGGDFDKVGGAVRGSVARLNADGTLDTAFNAGAGVGVGGGGGGVTALALQGGNVLVAGDFSHFSNQTRAGLLRLTATGAFDPTFDAGFNAGSIVLALAQDAGGGIFAGGSQIVSGGQIVGALARLDANGELDAGYLTASFPTPVNGAPDSRYAQNPPDQPPPGFVAALYLQDDGRLLAGGLFDGTVGGLVYHNLARLFPDGTLDPSFTPPVNPDPQSQPELLAVDALAVTSSGSLLVGTRVPQNYGRPFNGFPTDPIADVIINAIGLVAFKATAIQTQTGATTATVAVKRSFGAAGGSIMYSMAAGSAVAGRDFQSSTGTLSWVSGEVADRTFDIAIPADTRGGTVQLTLSGAANGVTTYAAGSKATLTIAPAAPTPTPTPTPMPTPTPTPTPPPPPGTPVVTVKVSSTGTAAGGGRRQTVSFSRTGGDTAQPLEVFYKANGSAKPGVEYKALPGQIIIPANAENVSIRIRQIKDGAATGARKFTIKLKIDPSGIYVPGTPHKAVVTIQDNG